LELMMETCVHDVTLKSGDSGPFLILRISRRYLDRDGRTVVECLESFIGR